MVQILFRGREIPVVLFLSLPTRRLPSLLLPFLPLPRLLLHQGGRHRGPPRVEGGGKTLPPFLPVAVAQARSLSHRPILNPAVLQTTHQVRAQVRPGPRLLPVALVRGQI